MKQIFYSVLFLITFLSCKNTTSAPLKAEQESVSDNSKVSDNIIYSEVADIKKRADYKAADKVQKLDLAYGALNLKIRYISDRAYIAMGNENNARTDWQPLKINFYYDMSFEDAEKDIHLLLKGNNTDDGYLLLPAFTEQYASYYVYYFKANTLNYLGNYEAANFSKGALSFDEKTKELYRSSDKAAKLNKIAEEDKVGSGHITEDVKLLKGNNEQTQTGGLDQYINNENYFVATFDVNKDGIKDKIVSHNRYQGDELLVFLGDKDEHYNLALRSTNFSEDGGNQIADIKETKEGYEVITEFPDRGYFQKKYLISCQSKSFLLKRMESESSSWQDGYTEHCVQQLNLNLAQSTESLLNSISSAKKTCSKTYEQSTK